jgi:hypothetical protein
MIKKGSGSVPLTNGFGSGRPENMEIRIPNTGSCILKQLYSDFDCDMDLQGEAVHLVPRLRDGVCTGACCLPRLYAGYLIFQCCRFVMYEYL